MNTQTIHDVEPQLAANRTFWCGWSGTEPGVDLPIYRSGIAHPLLNGVLRVRSRPIGDAIDEARRELSGLPWGWWVGADSDPGTEALLLARGATLFADMPVMAVDTSKYQDFSAPPSLKIVPATTRDEMTDLVRAYAGPLGHDVTNLNPVVAAEMNYASLDVLRLAGIVDGTTVATCTLSLGTEVAALYCIATDPAYRRRGIATALTVEAVRIAAESGRRVVTLQASSEGEPVYRRIGFETVSRYHCYQLT
ncbi:GNAT family N-acetyltransferase [Actinoplanes sp. TBRC 11911]|uniref:GNAT family N-acetyltransferase n=1 Tax=Actinoplanes sp. TBRC 11911 TaxID=2729386 RepID=UPI00145CCCD9|nr:N-acetyltransferase [Actinoplanes sp. TBRC 11911]NMO51475.1 GNAT family N-acetyltransferase [Actinoplanes sp. TBRC 11911]